MERNKNTNLKKLTTIELEKLVIESIKTNSENKKQVIDHYFKKLKMKPHKKIDNQFSFVECCLKYNQLDFLELYVNNLNISAPNYNIINICVAVNNPILLRKYIKCKNIAIL